MKPQLGLLFGCLCLVSPLLTNEMLKADETDAVKAVILQNASMVNRISSYHFVTEIYSPEGDEPGQPLRHETTSAVWCMPPNRRSVDRVFQSLGATGMEIYGEHGRVVETSSNTVSTRILSGWDFEFPPFKTPLQYGRNTREIDSVNGVILPTNPVYVESAIQRDRSIMRWDLLPGWPLSKVAEACELEEVPRKEPTIIRLKLISTTVPDVFNENSFDIGTIIDIDQARGGIICGIEYARNQTTVIHNAANIVQTSSGEWYVSKWQTIYAGKISGEVLVPACSINEKIEPSLLDVQFPEGARISDEISGKILIWGDGKPKETFSTNAEVMQYLYASAREFQAPPRTPLLPADRGQGWSLLILFNLFLVAVLVVLFAVRRLLGQSGHTTK